MRHKMTDQMAATLYFHRKKRREFAEFVSIFGEALFYTLYPGSVDAAGLSISEFYAACPVAHRSIYSADGSAFYAAETIITNIEASEYLNDGGELIGSATKGYAQYIDGTAESLLRRAYRYFGQTFPEPSAGFPFTLPFNLG